MTRDRKLKPLKMTAIEMLDWLDNEREKDRHRKKDPEAFLRTMANRRKKDAERRREKALARRGGEQLGANWKRRQAERLFKPKPDGTRQRILAALEPGGWYGLPDIAALVPDAKLGSVKAIVAQKLHKPGLLERTTNPAFRHDVPPGKQLEPQYLYRLTKAGVEARNDVLRFWPDSGAGRLNRVRDVGE